MCRLDLAAIHMACPYNSIPDSAGNACVLSKLEFIPLTKIACRTVMSEMSDLRDTVGLNHDRIIFEVCSLPPVSSDILVTNLPQG